MGSFWCGLGRRWSRHGGYAGSLVTLELHPKKDEAPDSWEESWASGGRPVGLHGQDQRAVDVGSPPRRPAVFLGASPGCEEKVGAEVPKGQEQPGLGVTGRACHWRDGWKGREGQRCGLRLEHGAVSRGQGRAGRPGEAGTPGAGPREGSLAAGPSGSSCLVYGGRGKLKLRGPLWPAGALPASPSPAPGPEPLSAEDSEARGPLSSRVSPH